VHRNNRIGLSQLPGATSAIPWWLPIMENVTIGCLGFKLPGISRIIPLPHGPNEIFLEAFHFRGRNRVLIVKPMEMEKSVSNVQTDLFRNGTAKSPGMTSRCLNADEDFSVLKRDNISRTTKIKKSTMQFRHSSV